MGWFSVLSDYILLYYCGVLWYLVCRTNTEERYTRHDIMCYIYIYHNFYHNIYTPAHEAYLHATNMDDVSAASWSNCISEIHFSNGEAFLRLIFLVIVTPIFKRVRNQKRSGGKWRREGRGRIFYHYTLRVPDTSDWRREPHSIPLCQTQYCGARVVRYVQIQNHSSSIQITLKR